MHPKSDETEKILKFCPFSSKHKLKNVCRTRWVERMEGKDIYGDPFVPVYLLFQEPENWKEEFMVFTNAYLEDFPTFTGLAADLDLWYNFWDEIKYKNDFAYSISVTLKRVDTLTFPNIYLALKVLGTLPITTCQCERSFSSLRSIKTGDRSTMANVTLNGLAFLFIHREIDLTVSEIIDSFVRKSRSILLKLHLPQLSMQQQQIVIS